MSRLKLGRLIFVAGILFDLCYWLYSVYVTGFPGDMNPWILFAGAMVSLAGLLEARELELEPGNGIEATIRKLMEIPGIGDWTAQYIAMRVLAYPDAFPHADLALRRALQVEKSADVLRLAEDWRPWRAYAAMCLWSSLEEAK